MWVGDITYLKVGGQWRYLAIVIDKYSRRVIGWSLGETKDVALTLASLKFSGIPSTPWSWVIFHTDRGIEYAGYAFRDRLTENRFRTEHEPPGEFIHRQRVYGVIFSLHESDVVHGVVFEQEKELQR